MAGEASETSGNNAPILAGVVGHPVTHSLSPLIHTFWARRAAIDGYYVPVAAPPSYEAFASVVDGLRRVGFAGVNVTLPHKENAFRYAGASTDRARAAAAANMLTFDGDTVHADNSDIPGFASALASVLEEGEDLGKALVLGAGGAARAIVLALKDAGCRRIAIANRTRRKAEALAQALGADDVVDWGARSAALSRSVVLVNTTSLGMAGQPPLDIDLSAMPAGGVVADIVYTPLKTPLLRQAAGAALRTVDGLAMLMHQAAPGFQQWFHGSASVDEELRQVLINELERRAAP